jgi:cytochrome c-type biogenesis protein CcmH/NrfG
LFELKKYSEALVSFESAIELDPRNADYWAYKREALIGMKNPVEAAEADKIYNDIIQESTAE